MPKDFENERHMKRGEFDVRSSSSGITATLWKDRKGILFLSNFHDPTDVSIVARKNKDGTSEDISCPETVKQYTANMRLVDKADMLKSLYEIEIVKSRGCRSFGISLMCQSSMPSLYTRKVV
jgi:hypothetical protein